MQRENPITINGKDLGDLCTEPHIFVSHFAQRGIAEYWFEDDRSGHLTLHIFQLLQLFHPSLCGKLFYGLRNTLFALSYLSIDHLL
jgi:hypothetical protein